MTDFHSLAAVVGVLLLAIPVVLHLLHTYWIAPYIDRTTSENGITE